MIKHFQDYYWKMGKPVGRGSVDPSHPLSYKIVVDPYYKRFTVEKYMKGIFERIVYDSYLLDFRHLKPHEQGAWERELISEDKNTATYFLRNQDDRIVLIETHHFDRNKCRICHIQSVHKIPVATQRMYYEAFDDPFNGVILYDLEERPIMKKTYDVSPETGEFNTLLLETWEMKSNEDR